jgi:hypothetical protein
VLKRTLAAVLGGGFILAALVAVPRLGPELGDAGTRLAHADRWLLALSLLAFLAAPACSGLAWRAALLPREATLAPIDAAAWYGIGCLVNTLVPAHLGSGLRIALLTASVPAEKRLRATASAGAMLSLARMSATVVLLAASFEPRIGVPAFVALALALRGSARWAFTAAGARVLAVACAIASLGVHAPLATALVLVPAIELAGVVQLAPANAGVLSAVAAFVLAQRGAVDTLALGLALHAVETVAGLSFGIASALVLAGLRFRRPVTLPVLRPAPALPALGD